MSDEQEWERRIEQGKCRFLVPTYTIKNHYYDPDAPYFVAGWYLSGGQLAKIVLTEHALSGRFNGANDPPK